MQTNQSAQHLASYKRWTWIVAFILALILLWMLFTGRGPSSACCEPAPAIPLSTSNETTSQPVTSNEFSFTATRDEVTSTGDASNVVWLTQLDKLKTILSGEGLRAQGSDKNILLSGTVDSEEIKNQKGADAQDFFGLNITIDNQLIVKASSQPATASSLPATVKLYFHSGKTLLPDDASTDLVTIIEWLKTHPESKAILSGYHDPSGDKALNEQLAKERAESVEDALEAAGIDDDRIEKRKPESVDGGSDLAEARRVEVSIE